MAKPVFGSYTNFEMEPAEELLATTFNVYQKMFLQNWRAQLKQELDNIPPDFDKPMEYFKAKLTYDAQIALLTQLIDLEPQGESASEADSAVQSNLG